MGFLQSGFKKFGSETLDPDEFNDYIASQVVAVYDTTADRDAYFASPGAFPVNEGMVVYVKAGSALYKRTGSGWEEIGATGPQGPTGATGAQGPEDQ